MKEYKFTIIKTDDITWQNPKTVPFFDKKINELASKGWQVKYFKPAMDGQYVAYITLMLEREKEQK